MSSDDFESLLEKLVPGSGRARGLEGAAELPPELGLEAIEVIAGGGTGWIWRARDPLLDRVVAVKVQREAGDHGRRLLLDEARVTASLEHPSVLPVHRVTVVDGIACIEFRLAPEATLRDVLLSDPDGWPIERRLRVLLGVVAALASAHARGACHGDLHPANIVVGPQGEPYVLDWSGAMSGPGFSGNPAYAAPEQLAGGPSTPAGDVYSAGAIAWELVTSRSLRPRGPEETLGEYVTRVRHLAVDPPSRWTTGLTPDLERWILDALAAEPARRPTSEALHARLFELLSGAAERDRRRTEAETLLDGARSELEAYRTLASRIAQEEQAAVVLRAKIPGHAPPAQKRAAWDAEARVAMLAESQEETLIRATETATLASTLSPVVEAAVGELVAELWWERLRRAEARRDEAGARLAVHRIERWDRGRWTRALRAPSHLSLTAEHAPGARARIDRFTARDLRLIPEPVAEVALPLERYALPPGSYQLVVSAPGFADAIYPVWLGRQEHHAARLRLRTAEELGQDWVLVPAGPFRMGGDPKARQPLDPCTPWIGDRLVSRTCVTTAAYLEFLDAIPFEEASRHIPGEEGLFGRGASYFAHDGERWRLPEGWDPRWPVFAVNQIDAMRYCAWRSEVEGRVVRLLTEEEWEKAARGVDGRWFPWGDGFDPTFAHMRSSRPGPPRPWRVGEYPVDTSVYGCRDMAGGMRELTASNFSEAQIVIRGGTWGDDADDLRCACRSGVQPSFRYSFVSFRVATEP